MKVSSPTGCAPAPSAVPIAPSPDSDPSEGAPPDSKLGHPYQESFVERVHHLLAKGYVGLCRSSTRVSMKDKDEPSITGFLVKAMNEARHDDQIRDWAWQFCVKDDPRVDDHGLEGNDRGRIDIQVQEQRRVLPEPCFQFEAKRLHDDDSLDKYMSTAGLQSILTGWYAREHDDAGMLAYVQAQPCETWAEQVNSRLGRRRKGYGLASAGEYWSKRTRPTGLTYSYTSYHPDAKDRPKRIHHTFLRCF